MNTVDPIILLEWTWVGGAVYRQAYAGGNVTWGGFEWERNHPQMGVCLGVEGIQEGGDEVSARDIALSVTQFLQGEIRDGRVTQAAIKIRGAKREDTGSVTVQSFVWDGLVSTYSGSLEIGGEFVLECAGRLAFDALADETSTFGPLSRARLVAGDTAFDRIGGNVMGSGGVVGGGGEFVEGSYLWNSRNGGQDR